MDYLRGLFALSIVCYHYGSWAGYRGPGTGVLSKLGIYGVGAFYVISGVSFGYIYRHLRLVPRELAAFSIKRFFRLAPLYWCAVAGTILVSFPTVPGAWTIVGNLTLLFGLVAPGANIPAGGWSIGNEIAFYCVFPLAIAALRHRQRGFLLLLILATGVAAFYAFVLLSPLEPLADQWQLYVRPENHFFLFMFGVVIAAGIGKVSLTAPWTYGLLLFLAVAFARMPTASDQIAYVTNASRFAFAGICIAVCGAAAVGDVALPAAAGRVLGWLGRISYSIYLLHPLVFAVANQLVRFALGGPTRPSLAAIVALPLTAAAASLIYRFVERPFVLVGKRMAERVLVPGCLPATQDAAAPSRTR